jgi:hypothetical protein
MTLVARASFPKATFEGLGVHSVDRHAQVVLMERVDGVSFVHRSAGAIRAAVVFDRFDTAVFESVLGTGRSSWRSWLRCSRHTDPPAADRSSDETEDHCRNRL